MQLWMTAIPNNRGEKGTASVTLCGFAYPLFSILKRESLSLSVSPFLSPFLLSTRDSYHRRRRRRSFSRPSPFTLSRTVFRRSSTQSSRPNEFAFRRPLRFHLPSLFSPLFSIHLSLLCCRCAVRRADPRSRTQSPPAFITRYEIARASSRFTHTYLLPSLPLALSGHDAVVIYIGKLCECRIMPDYASPGISSFLTETRHAGIPFISKKREIYAFLLLSRFHCKSNRNSIRRFYGIFLKIIGCSFNHRLFSQSKLIFFCRYIETL